MWLFHDRGDLTQIYKSSMLVFSPLRYIISQSVFIFRELYTKGYDTPSGCPWGGCLLRYGGGVGCGVGVEGSAPVTIPFTHPSAHQFNPAACAASHAPL